jgi:hypothetical protein
MAKIYPTSQNKTTSTHVKQDNSAEAEKFIANKFVLENFLFDKQLAFAQDPSPFKIAVCSRRAGKTVECAADLINTAIKNKGVVCLYITLAAANAKKLVWKELKQINKDYNLKAHINETELSMVFSNGSIVYCSGAKDASEIEKFRGLALKLVYIDECQSFREYLRDLIDDIIEPALMDHAGTLCLIGTPRPTPTGYFYECWNNPVWSKHFWTFFDNPHVVTKSKKTHKELLDRVLKRRGLTVDHPSIQREYFGKWEPDNESLLVKYDAKKNHFIEVPKHKTKPNYVMGVDIGHNDADALCILAWFDDSPITYLIEEKITPKQGITELVNQINELRASYDVSKIVMDMGGLGKKIGEEIIRRHQIPVEPAEKARKMENIELMNDALRTGRLMAKSNSRFAQDSYMVEIDRDKSTPEKIAVSSSYHSDIIDSVLYAFKLSPAYSWEPVKPKPKYGTREWAEQQTSAMFEAEMEGLQREQSYDRWLKGEG